MTLASWHSVCQTIVQSLCSTIISRRIVSTSKSYAFWHRNPIFLWSSTPIIFHVANAMLLEEFFFLSFTQHSYTTGEQVKFWKTGGEICQSRGKKINFRETRGKCTETGKIGGNSKFLVDEKRSSEILADENRNIIENFPQSLKIC